MYSVEIQPVDTELVSFRVNLKQVEETQHWLQYSSVTTMVEPESAPHTVYKHFLKQNCS